MQSSETLVDRILERLKNHKWVAPIIVAAIIVIALGTFTDSLIKLSDFLQTFNDPEARALRKNAGELHTLLSDFYQQHKDHPSLDMEFEQFRKQDSELVNRFFELYQELGIPESDLENLDNLLALRDYLLVYDIPPSNPEEIFPELWFVVTSIGAQRDRAIQDLEPEHIPSGEQTGYDEIANMLYSRALVSNPEMNAEEYAKELMNLWRKNYQEHRKFINFYNSMEFDSLYMSVELFRAQDSVIAEEFSSIYRRILVETPQVVESKAPYSAREMIEYLLIELEKIQH